MLLGSKLELNEAEKLQKIVQDDFLFSLIYCDHKVTD